LGRLSGVFIPFDNGFSAAVAATLINKKIEQATVISSEAEKSV